MFFVFGCFRSPALPRFYQQAGLVQSQSQVVRIDAEADFPHNTARSASSVRLEPAPTGHGEKLYDHLQSGGV
jgi:hypothetical protein